MSCRKFFQTTFNPTQLLAHGLLAEAGFDHAGVRRQLAVEDAGMDIAAILAKAGEGVGSIIQVGNTFFVTILLLPLTAPCFQIGRLRVEFDALLDEFLAAFIFADLATHDLRIGPLQVSPVAPNGLKLTSIEILK